jgi:hypothetical protein
MLLNEEFIRIYEELSNINDVDFDIKEAFDNEEVHGEAAKTIPGLIRYFVAHIETLANVIERGRILASTGESKSADNGSAKGKRLPFVSFSHQLFSHAYRRGSTWKYGIVVDQNKLEQKVQTLHNTTIEDNFVHQNKSSRVFGAAKLANGAEILITSYGNFEMNLSDTKRKALGNLSSTGYYEKVKASFDTRITREREKYADGHAKSISVADFYCTETPEFIKRYLKIDVDVVEGFLLVNRLQSTSIKFTDICKDVPGLFDYLQEHTTANEGELRVWLPKDQKYLDISGCIVGIVLPSNYKENNLDNPENTAPDVIWLRKLIKEKDLTVYVYQSKDDANIPNLDYSRKFKSTLEKPSIMEYFHKITSSREAVIDFVKNELTRYSSAGGYSPAYTNAILKNTSSTDHIDVINNEKYNYRAFVTASLEHGINLKDIAVIYKTGQPMLNATDAFAEKTSSAEAVQKFVRQIAAEYPSTKLGLSYTKWFTNNTNATKAPTSSTAIVPESASWNSFTSYCQQAFNYTSRDLTVFSKGQQVAVERMPIKELFKKITASKKAVLKYLKLFAEESSKFSYSELSNAYQAYVGKFASDSSYRKLGQDTSYNYSTWLEKITDPNGPVKLTKEEVIRYFKDCLACANTAKEIL